MEREKTSNTDLGLSCRSFCVLDNNFYQKSSARIRFAAISDFFRSFLTVFIQIAVLPQNTYETIQFSLEIKNRNDFAPAFPRSLAQISIPESYPVGARFEISDLAATDGDFLDQEKLKYKLTPDDLFRVEIEGERLFLVPTKQLDRESTSFVKGKTL